ncbi:hypothetical protein ACFX16_018856 [Malus domestica]
MAEHTAIGKPNDDSDPAVPRGLPCGPGNHGENGANRLVRRSWFSRSPASTASARVSSPSPARASSPSP